MKSPRTGGLVRQGGGENLDPAISAIGTARAENGVELAFETAGIVKDVKFRANQNVAKGEVLVQLDDTVERADLQDVQANVKRRRAISTVPRPCPPAATGPRPISTRPAPFWPPRGPGWPGCRRRSNRRP